MRLKNTALCRCRTNFILYCKDTLRVHSQLNDEDRGEAVVDIFRFDKEGKIVEHWDVIQAVPEKTETGRGIF